MAISDSTIFIAIGNHARYAVLSAADIKQCKSLKTKPAYSIVTPAKSARKPYPTGVAYPLYIGTTPADCKQIESLLDSGRFTVYTTEVSC